MTMYAQKHLRFVLILSALALACIMPAARGAAQNYVQNGGFEKGLSGWVWRVNGGAATTCSVDTAQRHWEENCVRLSGTEAHRESVQGRLTQTISGLTAGRTYSVTLWCKGKDAGARNEIVAGTRGQFRSRLPAGTYGWTRVQFPVVAASPDLPLMVVVQDKTQALWIADVYLTRDACTDVSRLGIAGDGVTDVTLALTAALAAHRFLFLPAGVYPLSAPILVPRGAIIWGDGDATVLQMRNPQAHAFLTASGTDAAPVGAEVTGIRFVAVPTKDEHRQMHALHFVKVDGLRVRRCSTLHCGLLLTETNKTAYSQVTSEADLSRNVRVAFNRVEAMRQSPSSSTGIELRYTTDAEVTGNTVENFGHGILWWGGDSAFGKDGAFANPKWARRIRIFGNTVKDSAGGGIWGSMGRNIVIRNNRVSDSGDVGIDFEGCFDSTADSNTVTDAHNGGLSTFFAAKNVTFRSNAVSTSHPNWPLFRSYNSSLDPTFGTGHLAGLGSVFQGNTFLCTSGIGIIDDHNGPNVLTFINNTLTNVCINISHVGSGANSLAPTIIGNTLTFRTDVPEFFAGINVFSNAGEATVSQNRLTYTGATGANKTGIQVQTQPNMSSTIRVTGNTVTGFGLADIFVYCCPDGKNTAIVSANHVQEKTITIGPSSAVTVQAEGNADGDGAAVAYKSAEEADKPRNHIVD